MKEKENELKHCYQSSSHVESAKNEKKKQKKEIIEIVCDIRVFQMPDKRTGIFVSVVRIQTLQLVPHITNTFFLFQPMHSRFKYMNAVVCWGFVAFIIVVVVVIIPFVFAVVKSSALINFTFSVFVL